MLISSDAIYFVFSFLCVSGITLLVLMLYLHRVRYEKNKIMTDGELRFYKILKYSVQDKYYVLSQVRLANVVKIPDRYFVWKSFNLLGAKCVDFVLIDKKSGETKLVIELDDKSHKRADRRKRDRFVDSILFEAKVPILHYKYQGRYSTDKIRKIIDLKVV